MRCDVIHSYMATYSGWTESRLRHHSLSISSSRIRCRSPHAKVLSRHCSLIVYSIEPVNIRHLRPSSTTRFSVQCSSGRTDAQYRGHVVHPPLACGSGHQYRHHRQGI